MTVTHVSRRAAVSAPSNVDQVALDVSAVTRLLEAEGILDYSGHVSARIPGRDAFAIQIGATSRAEVAPETMLVVDRAGTVTEGESEPPSELPIHLEILKSRPDVGAAGGRKTAAAHRCRNRADRTHGDARLAHPEALELLRAQGPQRGRAAARMDRRAGAEQGDDAARANGITNHPLISVIAR